MRPLLFALTAREGLAGPLAEVIGAELGHVEIRRFPDEETYFRYVSSPKGRQVIVLCSLDRPDEKYLPLVFAAATARDLGARSVGLVCPYLAYMRQDRRFRPGEAITSAHFARMLSGEFDWLVTVDPTGLIVSPAAVKEFGKDFGRHPSGTGPFKFAEWESNSKVVVEANPDYWKGAPDLKAVVFRPITDANTRVAEMLSGGIDVMVEVPPDNLATFSNDAAFKVYEQAGPHLWFLILNAKEGPMADKRVRQAVNYAIDKKALVENVLQGTAEVAAGPTPPAFAWAYNEALQPYPHDPEKAKALLKEAGHENADLTFYVTEGGSGMLDPVAMGAAIQADLAEVGLNAKIETYEWNTFLGKVNPGLEGVGDMAEMAWMTNDPDTLPYLALRTGAFPDEGGFNSGYYSNPDVDKLLEEARRETDQAKRAVLYKKMQEIVRDDAPWAFIANWKQNAVTSDRVEDFALQPSFFLLLDDVKKN